MDKNQISLIINCQKNDIPNIDISKFKDNYIHIFFNYNNLMDEIINNIQTKYYSIWDYNSNYTNINNLYIYTLEDSIKYIENPDISIIVCIYNTKPEIFQKCINGLLDQTFTNFEILCVNDGSEQYYLENYTFINQLQDKRFIWINKEHSGKSQTLNLGLQKARGKYIAINDSDDISFDNRLEYQITWLQNHESFDYISNNMVREDLVIFPNDFQPSQEVHKDNIHYCTNHPCSMFNKEKVLSKIPFLFSQFYDSYEDCIFHYMCFFFCF